MPDTFGPITARSFNSHHQRRLTRLVSNWILLVILAIAVFDTPGRSPRTAEATANVRLCGNKLVKMVTALCKGCIQGTRIDPVFKRALGASVSEPILDLNLLDDETSLGRNHHHRRYQQRWNPTDSYHDSIFGNRQRRSGIATECCERMCSYSYLKSFCCSAT